VKWDDFPGLETLVDRGELSHDLPWLFLGGELDPWRLFKQVGEVLPQASPVAWKEPWQPRVFSHQAGGSCCTQLYLHGLLLPWRSHTVATQATVLDDVYVNSQHVHTTTSLTTLTRYAVDLYEMLGVTCDESHHDFQEAVYPVDATAVNLEKLTDVKLPADLQELVAWPEGLGLGWFNCYAGRSFKLLILGSNYD
jgi:hypothetical protein